MLKYGGDPGREFAEAITILTIDHNWTIEQILDMDIQQFLTFLKLREKIRKRMEAHSRLKASTLR